MKRYERYHLLGETEDMGEERGIAAFTNRDLVYMELKHCGHVAAHGVASRYDIDPEEAQEYLEDLAEEDICVPFSEYKELKEKDEYDLDDKQATFDSF